MGRMSKWTPRPTLTGLALLLSVAVANAQVDSGQADFSRYVALGDSYGMAVTNGAIHRDAQLNGYPALIHRQVTGAAAGFEQPLVSDPGIPPILQLQSLVPLVITRKPGLGQPINLQLPRPYDNLSVSGANVGDALRTVTDNGGAHDLVLRGLGTQVQQALSLQPTFVTMWLGGNDALGAATSGIVIDDVTLTTLPRFEADYRALVGAIRGSGADMAIGTIPRVTVVPFVNTIPPVLVDPLTNEPVIVNGALIPLIGPNGPLSLADHVLLTASPLLAQGIGIPPPFGGGQPLPDQVVLDASESATIDDRIDGFNAIIRSVSQDFGIALFDLERFFNLDLADGLDIGGIEYTTEFLTGGVFSYDGVHLTPTGYALFANEVILSINQTFGAAIPLVDLAPFVFGPAGQTVGAGLPTTLAGSASTIFSRKAFKNLRFVLGTPGPKKLKRIKRRLAAGSG